MEAADRVVLDPHERRVIGTLIEKGLSTPQAYPLSLNALTTGCNQRNNREPITNFTDEQVEEIAQRLQARGLVPVVHPATGRVYRYRQEFGRNYEMRRAELAVLGELLLRGAQTEGELRQRASRMENIATLDDLHQILNGLRAKTPSFVVRITPEGTSRGVVWSHACCEAAELDQLKERERSGVAFASASPSSGSSVAEVAVPRDDLIARIEALERRVARLEQHEGRGGPNDA